MSVAIVSGAASGLGLAFARRLAAEGYDVLAFDTVLSVEGVPEVTGIVADVSRRRDAERVVEQAAGLGEIRVLVNNAAVWRRTPVDGDWEQAVTDWDDVMDVNLKGLLLLSRATIPHLKRAGGGHVINVSASLVLPVRDGAANDRESDVYDASKWALNGLTDAWAKYLKKDAITVNGLCPGPVDTSMLRAQLGDGPLPADVLEADDVADLLIEIIASGRSGENFGAWVGEPVGLGARPPAHRRITG